MAEAIDESHLVDLAVRGEGDAFRMLVDQHGRSVYRLAWRLTGNSGDAEDVVQETFMRAYRNLSRFDARARFSTWIHAIATHCALDLLRSRKRAASRIEEAMKLRDESESARQERIFLSEQFREHFERALGEL